MRRWSFILLFSVLMTVFSSASHSAPVQVDGELLPGSCYVSDGVTYAPMRAVLNAFGTWEVDWDEQTAQAVAVSDGHRVAADPDEDFLTVDDAVFPCQVTVLQGCTYLPLRLLTEALGGSVRWDAYLQGAAVTSPDAPCDAADLYWLARIISAESGDEPYLGQIAVGNVVLNRVADASFPDSIPAVIFDRTDGVQFEPVQNGTVYACPAASSVAAAEAVLSGEVAVPDALYFYAPALSQGVWINSHCRYITTIGGHRFYR